VYAENFMLELLVFDDGSQRQILKHVVDALEDRAWVVDVFAEALLALFAESEMPIDVAVFVVSTEQDNLFRVLQFERH
jgi:hypothetical protein